LTARPAACFIEKMQAGTRDAYFEERREVALRLALLCRSWPDGVAARPNQYAPLDALFEMSGRNCTLSSVSTIVQTAVARRTGRVIIAVLALVGAVGPWTAPRIYPARS
jgi:hypothetical protein